MERFTCTYINYAKRQNLCLCLSLNMQMEAVNT